MKTLCKELGLEYNPDLTTTQRKHDVILSDRGRVIKALSPANPIVAAYLDRCRPEVECSLCSVFSKIYISFNGYDICSTCQAMLRKIL